MERGNFKFCSGDKVRLLKNYDEFKTGYTGEVVCKCFFHNTNPYYYVQMDKIDKIETNLRFSPSSVWLYCSEDDIQKIDLQKKVLVPRCTCTLEQIMLGGCVCGAIKRFNLTTGNK